MMRHADCDSCINTDVNLLAAVSLISIGVVLGMAVLGVVRHFDSPAPVRDGQLDCQLCHSRQVAMVDYFKRKGVDDPARLADAVLHPVVKRPRLMAALAVKESPKQKPGDGGQSKGYYQVKEKHWRHLLRERKVSRDPLTQTIDSQLILESLVNESGGNLHRALNKYGGCRDGRYSRMILAELVNVP